MSSASTLEITSTTANATGACGASSGNCETAQYLPGPGMFYSPARASAGGQSPSPNNKPIPSDARKQAQTQAVEKVKALMSSEATFLDQLEMSIANRYLLEALAGAEQMITSEGDPVPEALDRFHNYMDEFIRALDQLDAGAIPATSDYGKDANNRAKSLKKALTRDELKKTGVRIRKEIISIKAHVNATPGLEDVLTSKSRDASLSEFVAYAHRVERNIQVLIGNVGLGPVFTPAKAEADVVREQLVKLMQATNGLESADEEGQAGAWKDFDTWFASAKEAVVSLGRNAQAWKLSALGSRGPLAAERMADLGKAARLAKARVSKH